MSYVGDRFSILAALPSGHDGMKSLKESLSAETLEKWRQNLQYESFMVSIPKFEIKVHYDLIPVLKNLALRSFLAGGT